jgi:hypothetical protein
MPPYDSPPPPSTYPYLRACHCRFPDKVYKQMSEPDPCGNRLRGIDLHLTGGAYLHLLELELGLLSLRQPLCLPQAYTPFR